MSASDIRDLLGLVFGDPNIEASAVKKNEAIWFDGLETQVVEEIQRRGFCINPEVESILPPTSEIMDFLDEYPVFESFGWVCPHSDEDPTLYITGVEYTDTAINKPIYSREEIDDDDFRNLKNRFFNTFSDALRLEMNPELMLADYAWTPERPLEVVEMRWFSNSR